MDTLKENEYVILIFRIQFITGNYATFDKAQIVSKNDKELLTTRLDHIYDLKNEDYKFTEIKRIIIEYFVKENKSDKPIHLLSTLKNISKTNSPVKDLNKKIVNFSSYNIPLNREYQS